MNCQVLPLPESGLMAERIKQLKELFIAEYGTCPEFYTRAPGRVNLIGEHIDYCGYAVFPMAIKQDILMAFAKRDDRKLCLSNVDPQYENFKCDIDTYERHGQCTTALRCHGQCTTPLRRHVQCTTIPEMPRPVYHPRSRDGQCTIPGVATDSVPSPESPRAGGVSLLKDIECKWYKYFLCGLQGLKEEGRLATPLTGISVLVIGSIPPAAGLSSSSALVCAAALLISHGFKADISVHAMAELCARSERYIGMEGGGMDQAASLLSNTGSAQVIEFNPLRCTPVILPEGAMFVVANTLVKKNKAAGSEYNTRVVECRLACRVIAQNSSLTINGNIQLGELQNRLGGNFSEMVELVKEFLHPQPYSKQELCKLLNMSVEQLEKEVLSANTVHLTEFDLYKRALHVFTEASRVWEFKHICDQWNSFPAGSSEAKVLQRLGKLMEESHSSAQNLYECSHPQLDKLTKLSKGIAYGARLTGAGWGGCIVALVDQGRVNEYLDLIKEEYYNAEGLKVEDWSSVLFSTEPSGGAQIYTAIPALENDH